MNSSQIMLDFSAKPAPKPAETDAVVAWLSANPGFHSAARISAALGLTDRAIRTAAAASGGLIVSGPGTPGYCHLSHCPPASVSQAAETMISQGRNMIRRALEMRRRAHALIR